MKCERTNKKKELIRNKIIGLREQIKPRDNFIAAKAIANLFTSLPIYSTSKHIAVYYSFKHEISTIPLLSQILNDGKNCYLPVISSYTSKEINFVKYTLNTKLTRNKYGILEPFCSPNDYINLKTLDIIVVPSIAFDANKNRLGIGGGYYDILLKKLSNLPNNKKIFSVGIGFEFQKIDNVPKLEHDIPLDKIITEKNIY